MSIIIVKTSGKRESILCRGRYYQCGLLFPGRQTLCPSLTYDDPARRNNSGAAVIDNYVDSWGYLLIRCSLIGAYDRERAPRSLPFLLFSLRLTTSFSLLVSMEIDAFTGHWSYATLYYRKVVMAGYLLATFKKPVVRDHIINNPPQ